MKIALITDQHLDGRKGSLPFWNYFQKFYDDVFFPTLEKEGVKVIIDLGDTFDNRKSMDYNTFNRIDSISNRSNKSNSNRHALDRQVFSCIQA